MTASDSVLSTASDRRTFIRGAALSAGAACVAANMAMPAAARADGEGWDLEADVVVVGTGTAAVAAAAASYYGANKVVVLEKAGIFGGTTMYSGQGVGIPLSDAEFEAGVEDSIEQVMTYYRSASNNRIDEAVSRSYVENGNEFLRWTGEAFGMTWGFTVPAFQDYYEPSEGYVPFGRGNISVIACEGYPEDQPPRPWSLLEESLEADSNVELLFNTPATDLIVEDGRVVGVAATGEDGTPLRVHALKGVVLGTGGFDYNDEMRRSYLGFPYFVTNAAPGNTGDGHRMGMAIGAATAYMDRAWGLPCFLPGGEDPAELIANNQIVNTMVGNDWAMYRGKPGALVVNRCGRRFADEAEVYGSFNLSFGNYDTHFSNTPNIPAYFICDSGYTAAYTLPGQATVGDPVPDFIVQADTLEELAEKLGIEVEGLLEQVEEFNANAEQGLDPQFGRGQKSIDVNTTGLFAGMREDLSNPCLAPVQTAPFYGAVYVPGTCGTCGGLKINESAQVMSVGGNPIEGLYAVGNCSSGVSGGMYMHGGMTVGSGAVMSWVAVRHLLGVSE